MKNNFLSKWVVIVGVGLMVRYGVPVAFAEATVSPASAVKQPRVGGTDGGLKGFTQPTPTQKPKVETSLRRIEGNSDSLKKLQEIIRKQEEEKQMLLESLREAEAEKNRLERDVTHLQLGNSGVEAPGELIEQDHIVRQEEVPEEAIVEEVFKPKPFSTEKSQKLQRLQQEISEKLEKRRDTSKQKQEKPPLENHDKEVNAGSQSLSQRALNLSSSSNNQGAQEIETLKAENARLKE